ncbi:hypothetical protein QE410_003248 [Microbacterium sp. SORGH_AS 1204]|uniref:hypothetical protein n=1 Tax=Microbacterium sp. SORGH_AS_1204 TaxID=3041785 RepID=UPI00278E2156|nr:hypothetical protein [Microbacterium sp. SORGH_AS_1204]MDQ1138449.1 hypothetical protein [Microbacterium sp. SORGH_AS_1204]
MASRRKDVSSRVFTYGDIDTRGATGGDRLAILDAEERAALFQAKSNGEGAIRNAYTRYQDALLRYKRRRDRREEKNKAHEPRIAFAEAWRALNAQERYPHAHLHWLAQVVIFGLLAGLDFYVFAQAYAVVDDLAEFSIQWWLGGLLGLVVFVAGIILARQIKAIIVATSQHSLVKDLQDDIPTKRPQYTVRGESRTLPYTRASGLALTLSGSIFIALVGLAIWVRLDATTGDLPAVMMTGIIPIVIVAVEIYIHDPLFRLVQKPGRRERSAERRARKRGVELENIIASYDSFIRKTRAGFAHQRQIAKVTAADLGIDTDSDTPQGEGSEDGEWEIKIDDLLKTKVPLGVFHDDVSIYAVAPAQLSEDDHESPR